MWPHTSYIVCATPRCGSSLLDGALKNTGIMGVPDEYFLSQNKRLWQKAWNAPTFSEYMAEVLRRGTSPNGVFGMKMMWGYFGHFSKQVQRLPGNRYRTTHEALNTIFPELSYIWMRRRDKVRQAVSHAKARQTNVWVVTDALAPETIEKPVFSFQQIDFMVRELETHDAAWQHYFAIHGICPYSVFYEDFVEHYEETALNIMRYLHIPVPEQVHFMPRRLQRQADAQSEEWVQRYYDLKQCKGLYHIAASMITLFGPRFRPSLFGAPPSIDTSSPVDS
jgi:trehalose 2-sulfotransferase